MKTGEYFQKRFQLWARRQARIAPLQGSKGERGELNYTQTLDENLFQPFSADARADFEKAAGQELVGNPCPMQALHSSAAMAVNLFGYFRQQQILEQAARILRIPSRQITAMTFERQYPIIANYREHGLTEPPHLDVGFDYEILQRVGVECKLFEPFGRLGHAKLREAYLDLPDVWSDIPACRKLAEELVEDSAGFIQLGPAQLLRHILGLKFGLAAGQFRLIYLYYDGPGDEAAAHRSEIKRFSELIATDGIIFQAMSVQSFIIRATSILSEKHNRFINYLCERYL